MKFRITLNRLVEQLNPLLNNTGRVTQYSEAAWLTCALPDGYLKVTVDDGGVTVHRYNSDDAIVAQVENIVADNLVVVQIVTAILAGVFTDVQN